jgi:hypothetical protein
VVAATPWIFCSNTKPDCLIFKIKQPRQKSMVSVRDHFRSPPNTYQSDIKTNPRRPVVAVRGGDCHRTCSHDLFFLSRVLALRSLKMGCARVSHFLDLCPLLLIWNSLPTFKVFPFCWAHRTKRFFRESATESQQRYIKDGNRKHSTSKDNERLTASVLRYPCLLVVNGCVNTNILPWLRESSRRRVESYRITSRHPLTES